MGRVVRALPIPLAFFAVLACSARADPAPSPLEDPISVLRFAGGFQASGWDDIENLDAGHSSTLDIANAVRLARQANRLDAPSRAQFQFSFENDFQGWGVNGTDLGDPPVAWSITRSSEFLGSGGTTNLKLYLNNLNDAGKIWIERPFIVLPNRAYRVALRYSFASRDFGFMNLFRIIAGASAKRPEAREDLTFQDYTGNGASSDTGYAWLFKQYDLDATSGPDGLLWLTIGVWGTWETPRTYYLDSIAVNFYPK